MSDIPEEFTKEYYDEEYFVGSKGGKKFRKANGSIGKWSYYNPQGEFLGAKEIAKAWKIIFNPNNALDVGCGRGTFVAYMRDLGIEAYGFDFSEYAINNPYVRCKKEWLKVQDATKPWQYDDKSFDLVIALDFFEHLYIDDLDFVINEMYRVAKKWVFLQIAIVGGGSGSGIHEKGYIIRRGEKPIELEGNMVAGHVTVQPIDFWYEKLDREDWIPRRDLVNYFIALVPNEIIKNWLVNAIIIMERI